MYNSQTFEEVNNRLKDWMINDVDSANIANRSLDLINRAKDTLLEYKPWNDLTKRSELTITNKQASVPSDFGYLAGYKVFSQTNDNSGPNVFYYEGQRFNYGYRWANAFTKDGGHDKSIIFYQTPPYSVYIEYVMALEDYTGSGTEYLFFPAELTLRAAQVRHIIESGITGSEVTQIREDYQLLLDQYTSQNQYVNRQQSWHPTDMYDSHIQFDDFDLVGGGDIDSHIDCSYQDRSFDCG